ncbi:MAG: hypothetical protein NUV74_08360 [Candidatus Brocadiaceae bacterium]|nr:hypothetical protein [Candidatus Brocadiaceae bacterium]
MSNTYSQIYIQIVFAVKGRLNLTKQMGMKTKMLLMAGNPGEDDHTVNDTIRMIEWYVRTLFRFKR